MLIIFTQYCISLNSLSALIGINNATIKSVRPIIQPYAKHPIFLFNHHFQGSRLAIDSMKFINISNYALTGIISHLDITNSVFRRVLRPIKLQGDGSQQHSQNSRIIMQKKDGPLNLRDVIFDVCGGLTSDKFQSEGGSMYTDSISVQLSSVEFRKSRAENAGAFYASNSEIYLDESSFIQCESTKDCGGAWFENSNVVMKESFFVRNHAGQDHGALYFEKCYTQMNKVSFIENKASRSYGGITVDNSLGQIISCSFIDNNSPKESGGTSLNIPSTSDLLVVEFSTFTGFQSYVRFDAKSQLRIFECCFDTSEGDSKTIIDGASLSQSVMFSNSYSQQCKPTVKMPTRLYMEIFQHWLDAMPLDWWRMYTALGFFLFLIFMMIFSIPIVFFPKIPGSTKRGNSVNQA